MVDAVLPAGGRISGSFAAEAGAEVKALIPLGGITVLERTIDMLRATGCVERIVVIGPDELLAHPASKLADHVLHSDPSNSGPTNILAGLDWLRTARGGDHAGRVLVVTTDLPFVTRDAIEGFVDACPGDSDICVPVISRGEFEGAYPNSSNFYVRLADGEWTIGSAFLVDPVSIERNRALIEQVFRARKSQLGMARLLGVGLVVRFLTRRLTVSVIEKRCRRMLGCSTAAVFGCSPSLGYDIDNIKEFHYAADRLRRGPHVEG